MQCTYHTDEQKYTEIYAIILHVCRFRIDFGNMYAKKKCECY